MRVTGDIADFFVSDQGPVVAIPDTHTYVVDSPTTLIGRAVSVFNKGRFYPATVRAVDSSTSVRGGVNYFILLDAPGLTADDTVGGHLCTFGPM